MEKENINERLLNYCWEARSQGDTHVPPMHPHWMAQHSFLHRLIQHMIIENLFSIKRLVTSYWGGVRG